MEEYGERVDLLEAVTDDCIEDMGGDTGEFTREEIREMIRQVSDAVWEAMKEDMDKPLTQEDIDYLNSLPDYEEELVPVFDD